MRGPISAGNIIAANGINSPIAVVLTAVLIVGILVMTLVTLSRMARRK
ncbi:hypothetical protein BZB76_5361 [Actinomadura pelletieri DSM 43383]|uniref:Uncharacterized protein n=1 Tax=Actinomadura pelletieri DSM 43383 TaxID=1120940 RepID=A0A495QGN7_9ACTN|nr:hypothetical protein BZB76_5361 [Actinomadura pelletieri DSM 43383]